MNTGKTVKPAVKAVAQILLNTKGVRKVSELTGLSENMVRALKYQSIPNPAMVEEIKKALPGKSYRNASLFNDLAFTSGLKGKSQEAKNYQISSKVAQQEGQEMEGLPIELILNRNMAYEAQTELEKTKALVKALAFELNQQDRTGYEPVTLESPQVIDNKG